MRSDVTLVTVLALAGSIGKPPHYTIINHLIAPHSAAFGFALLACPACLDMTVFDGTNLREETNNDATLNLMTFINAVRKITIRHLNRLKKLWQRGFATL